MKKQKRKIPRNAVKPLFEMCEDLSEKGGGPATEIFKTFLELMDIYDDYFFSEPWPEKYDYDTATTFTDEDVRFLHENEEEFGLRYMTVCLKKNMNLENGFMQFGMFWTRQAYHEKFVRPTYKPVLEVFNGFAEKNEDAAAVLNKLKEQFDVKLIHDSLVDLLEHEYPDKTRRLLIAKILELIHTKEGLPACNEYQCKLQREELNENKDDKADG